jgi:preprotein translocase subunit SecY
MTMGTPPAGAVWLLRYVARYRDDIADDLLEEYQGGRSDDWYWRQVLVAILATRAREAGCFAAGVGLYLIGHRLPVPGINMPALALLASWQPSSAFSTFDLATGGNFARVTVLALGLYPFVLAALAVQAAAVIARLAAKRTLRHRPSATRLLTVLIATLQAYGLARYLNDLSTAPNGLRLVVAPGAAFEATTIAVLVIGAVVLMAVSDYVTARGFGNGMLLALLAAIGAGAIDHLPAAANASLPVGPQPGLLHLFVLVVIVLLVSRAHRRTLTST